MQLTRGIRVVALFEAAKGLLVLLAGCGLLTIIHQDVQQLAEDLVLHFHLNPASHYPRIFLQLAGNVSSGQLWLMAGFALFYASVRWCEAWGLWYKQRWAEWLAVVSGGIYLPIEIYELYSGFSWIKVCTLTLNIVIVLYMAAVLRARTESLVLSP